MTILQFICIQGLKWRLLSYSGTKGVLCILQDGPPFFIPPTPATFLYSQNHHHKNTNFHFCCLLPLTLSHSLNVKWAQHDPHNFENQGKNSAFIINQHKVD